MPGEVDADRDGRGMMKSSVSPESAEGCMMTVTPSSIVSCNVLDTLNCREY